MVTEDGDHSIRLVVCVQFLLDGSIVRSLLVKLNLESLRSVEGTKNLGGKSLHVPVKVSVQLGGLPNVDGGYQFPTTRKETNRIRTWTRSSRASSSVLFCLKILIFLNT